MPHASLTVGPLGCLSVITTVSSTSTSPPPARPPFLLDKGRSSAKDWGSWVPVGMAGRG